MNKKFRIKIALSLFVFSLSGYADISTGFGQACSGDAQCGQWQPVIANWPNYAVHTALVVTGAIPAAWIGKVFFFGDDISGTNTIELAKLWDPQCGTDAPNCFQDVRLTIPNSNFQTIFCSGHSFLQDGKLLVAGGDTLTNPGQGHVRSFSFDPFNLSGPSPGWTTLAPLNDPVCFLPGPACDGGRYYPSNVTVKHPGYLKAQVLTFHGLNKNGTGYPNRSVERYDVGTNTWTVDSVSIPINPLSAQYPWLHVLPAQPITTPKVFFSGHFDGDLVIPPPTSRFAYKYDVVNRTWEQVGSARSLKRISGTSVMLPLTEGSGGRVLVIGGTDPVTGPTNTTDFICFSPLHSTCNSTLEQWMSTAPMANARVSANAVLLPDGNVLEVGGESQDCSDPFSTCPPACGPPVYVAELFNPTTMTWMQLPAMTRPRQYHSTAVLLPDASVLAAGGETDQNCACLGGRTPPCPTAQVYKPGYFFRGPRPTITNVSASIINYNQQITVTIDQAVDTNTKVLLIRPSSVTHSFNFEQRSVELTVVTRGANSITVQAPSTPNLAPPGFYMLFVVNQGAQGALPSTARFVQVLPL